MGRGERLPDGQRAVGEVGTGRQQRQLDRIAEVTMEPEQRLDAGDAATHDQDPGTSARVHHAVTPTGASAAAASSTARGTMTTEHVA